MNIIRSWREQKILLKRMFPILRDEDFLLEDGGMEKVLKVLQVKLNKSQTELELLLAELQTY